MPQTHISYTQPPIGIRERFGVVQRCTTPKPCVVCDQIVLSWINWIMVGHTGDHP